MKPPLILQTDHGRCLIRSTVRQRQAVERLLFRRYPDREWAAFFRFGYRRTRWGIVLCWVDLLPPGEGDLDPRSAIVEFSPQYVRRALRVLAGCKFGVGVIHSHPEDGWPCPSALDDDMDGYFATEFERYGEGRPYASLIIARDGRGQRSFSGRVFDRGTWLPVLDWVASSNEVIHREIAFQPDTVLPPPSSDVARARLAELMGTHRLRHLRGATVGIVGCSGLGTPAVHVLARAGIGRFVLVDKGRYKPSNHERNHASRAVDLAASPMWKVDLLQRLIAEIDPSIGVTTIVGDVLDDLTLDELLRCDLIVGCTDSVYARAALGDLAVHYQLPVLDLAVQMREENEALKDQVGEVALYLPGLPCPWCRGRVSAREIREETLSPEEMRLMQEAAEAAWDRGEDGAQYWTGGGSELTVGYMTTAVGAIGAGYVQHLLTGIARVPHPRFQFDLGLREFGFVKDERLGQPDCACQRCTGVADQGKADRTVSKPTHWPEAFLTGED